MIDQPIGGSMDEKVSVSLRMMDDGKIVCSRSWQEGKGEKKEFKNEEFEISEDDMGPMMKRMFQKGPMKKDRVKGIAEDLEEKPKKEPKWVDDGKDYDEEPKKGMFGRAGKMGMEK